MDRKELEAKQKLEELYPGSENMIQALLKSGYTYQRILQEFEEYGL